MIRHLAAAVLTASLLTAAPASAMGACPTEDSAGPCHWNARTQGNHQGTSFTAYRHHRIVRGESTLNLRQVHRVERIVHHLPECKPWPWQPTNCREFVGRRHTLASFHLNQRIYYVGLIRGRLDYVEVHHA